MPNPNCVTPRLRMFSRWEALRIQPFCNRVTSLIRGGPLHVAHLPIFSATQSPATPSRREHRSSFRRGVIEVVAIEHIFRMRLSCPIELRTGLQGGQAVL